MKNTTARLRLAVFFTLSLMLWLSCAINPVTGKKEFMLLSEKQEQAMGLAYDPQVISQFGMYDDKNLQDFITRYGEKMGRISHRPQLNYQFRILDSPVVNAFAVPGGYVYFTRGIMAHFNNEAEFAGVLGHEIGHVAARHSAKQYSSTVLAQLGFAVGMLVSKDFRNYSGLAGMGLNLLFLKFSRSHESESDKLGVEYSTKIGYDAHEMANFFQTIGRIQAQSGGGVPTLLSTHPDPGNRYTRVHQLAAKEQAKTPGQKLEVNRDQYLRMIDGIVYGEDPRQGYVENNYFYHPEMKFQFPVPSGWQTVNSPAQVQIAPKDGKAVILLTLSGEKSLPAARQAAIAQDSLKVLDSRNIRVNGNDAIELTADLNPQVRLLMYLIQYNGNIYKFTGLAGTPDFNTYKPYFDKTFSNFKSLTDPKKINVKPEIIRIKTVSSDGTLESTLRGFKASPSRLEELAILNGMQLKDSVKKGTLIKVLESKE
ncbi:MAG: peptidase M48 [Saprospiraceae bacterium]|nr:MAG: peptidase M48 [Saprospiraceae bacterium]